MTRRLDWAVEAEADLLDIHWRIAGDVAAAVKLFALTDVGLVIRWPNFDGPDEYRLYVPPHRYYARIRYSKTVVYVERVLRSP